MTDELDKIRAARAPIRIDCTTPGHEGEHVVYKADGWKFGHLRIWEETEGAQALAGVISERIESWHLLDDAGKEIPFVPQITLNGTTSPNPAVLDEVPPGVSSWLIYSFRQAYTFAGRPNPNA